MKHRTEYKDNHTIKNKGYDTRKGPISHLILMITLMILCFYLPGQIVNASSSIKIYDYATKKTTNYKDQQLKVALNNKQISINKTPGILDQGVALVSYYDIFRASGIKADTVYNKAKGTVTITRGKTTIVLTINSKKATVNGKSVALSVAPKKLKFPATNQTKIYVPSRFVAENLGLGYVWNSSTSTVSITDSALQISYGSVSKHIYTGTKAKVSFDGKNIGLGNMPSIIINNTTMLRAKKVVGDVLGATYKYNKSEKKVTLSKGDTTLVMTLGSKTAYLNGQKITLSAAPVSVKNHGVNTSFIMVPGSIVVTSLGYDYSWNQTTKTAIIKTRTSTDDNASDNDEPDDNEEPELGDSDDLYEEGLILNHYNGIETLIGQSSQVSTIPNTNTSADPQGYLLSVIRDTNNKKKNAETYAIYSSSPLGNITSNIVDDKIQINAGNLLVQDQEYSFVGSSNLVGSITSQYQSKDLSTIFTMNLSTSNVTYDVALSADRMILYVTVYTNNLKTITIGTNDVADYVTFEGKSDLVYTTTKEDGKVTIEFPYLTYPMTDSQGYITGAKHLNSFYTTEIQGKLQFVILTNGNYDVKTELKGKQLRVFFVSHDSIEDEDTEVIDASKYQVIIPRPAIVTNSMIYDYDDYFNNKIEIKLQGDYTAFFKQYSVTKNSNVIKSINVTLNSYNETIVIITTSKLQGYEYVMDKKNIYVRIGNPRDIYKNIVVLDPGHGGAAKGATYFNTNEKDINFTILHDMGKKYFNSDSSKLKVYFTRITDVDMSLADRAAFAKKVGADLFVSLHMNAFTKSSVNGTEVYYSSVNTGTLNGLNSKKLASLFLDNLIEVLDTTNRGAKDYAYAVVKNNTVPAVLIELGFISNPSDFALITDPVIQDKSVKVIYDTILEVFEKYPTGR